MTNANFENIPQNNETIRTLIFRSRPRPTCVITLLDSFYRQFFRPSHSTVRFRCQNATFQRQSGRWRWRPVTIGCVPGVSIFMATNHNELTITLGQDPKVSPLAFDVRDFSARVGCPLLMFDSWCSATDCLITIFLWKMGVWVICSFDGVEPTIATPTYFARMDRTMCWP